MLFKYISEVANIKKVHLLIIPKLNQSLKSILQLKSTSCFALKTLVLSNNNNYTINNKNIDTATNTISDNNINHSINTNNNDNNTNNMIDNMKQYDINNEVMQAGIDNLRDYLLLIRNNNHIDINNKDNYY